MSVTAAREVLTVGHSTHPIEGFLELLAGAGVELVADVRRHPGSRRNPQFGAAALAGSLRGEGIGYAGLGETLGGRRSAPKREPGAGRAGSAPKGEPGAGEPPDNSAWQNPSFRAYADHMWSGEFDSGLRELESLAAGSRTAVMCAEAHPSRCHRRLVADALLARGWRVLHLLPDGRLEGHELSPHAIVAGEGRVSYPGQPRLDV